jgi:GMP synthase-like glutamine amidotransferase
VRPLGRVRSNALRPAGVDLCRRGGPAREWAAVRVLFVHHDPNSGDGHVGRAFEALGAEVVRHQVCREPGSPTGSPAFPDPTSFDRVVVFGSRWSVDDAAVAHWVEPELEMLRVADRAGVPVLGLCFGGQLLATALGGSVGRTDHPEIGWLTIDVNDAGEAAGIETGPWLQWHFDRFTVPPDATELARTVAGPQAFSQGPHLGLQFHPEADREVLQGWMVDDLDQLEAAGLDPASLLEGAGRHRADGSERARRLVARFAGEGAARPTRR